jgi:prepilin-type processing-associated H-X9-DG protein
MDKRPRNLGLGFSIDLINPNNPRSGEIKVSRVKAPAEMIAIADAITPRLPWPPFEIVNGDTSPPGRIHSGGANVLFCDGHVQWYEQKGLLALGYTSNSRDLAVLRMWNNDHEP